MRSTLRSLVRRGLTVSRAGSMFAPLMSGRATVFMLHRFQRPGRRISGDDPEGLRTVLACLRRERYELMDLEGLVAGLVEGDPRASRAVAFTIDDGYADQADIGAPVFREFDCPVTTFVTSGFLDRDLWFWWDRIEYVFLHTPMPTVTLPMEGEPTVRLETSAQRRRAQAVFTSWCKGVSDSRKHEAIEALATRANLETPSDAPAEYAPMSWDQLRRCEEGGMRFGPHTETHPILSRVPDDQARQEILGSWARLCKEARQPSPVFCYPNGQADDYGTREIRLLREAGLEAAVVGMPGHLSRKTLHDEPDALFQLPRIVFNTDPGRIIQYASGMDRLLDLFRRGSS